jgi:hypothetical protein
MPTWSTGVLSTAEIPSTAPTYGQLQKRQNLHEASVRCVKCSTYDALAFGFFVSLPCFVVVIRWRPNCKDPFHLEAASVLPSDALVTRPPTYVVSQQTCMSECAVVMRFARVRTSTVSDTNPWPRSTFLDVTKFY